MLMNVSKKKHVYNMFKYVQRHGLMTDLSTNLFNCTVQGLDFDLILGSGTTEVPSNSSI